jgi:sodium/potassium-transporting ATPase subunit alpha
MVKGAPDVLIGRCSFVTSQDGSTKPLVSSDIVRIESIKDNWSRQGKRVILLARKALPGGTLKNLTSSASEREVMNCAQEGLTLVGLVGIVDPPVSFVPRGCCMLLTLLLSPL